MFYQLIFHVTQRYADEPSCNRDYTLSENAMKQKMPSVYTLAQHGDTVEITSHDGLEYFKVEPERRVI